MHPDPVITETREPWPDQTHYQTRLLAGQSVYVCKRCGLYAADPDLHDEWHKTVAHKGHGHTGLQTVG